MTREEAEAVAKSMPRLKALVDVRNNIDTEEWLGLDILLKGGGAIGIGNPEALKIVRETLINLLDKQIEEEKAKESGNDGQRA